MIKFDFESYIQKEIGKENIIAYSNQVDRARDTFLRENKMIDWYNFDTAVSNEELVDIMTTANFIRSNCDVFLVIGIGGSSLGAQAIIEALSPYFRKNLPEIIFAGNSLSSDYLASLIDYISDKEVMINVISKSGNTLEPSVAFNAIYRSLKDRYTDEQIAQRIIVTTDKEQGHLLEMAKRIECKRFEFPQNIGGRFSVLTVVGLLPVAVAGIDIYALLDGAKAAKANTRSYYQYIAIRDILYQKGKTVEVFNVYEPKLYAFTEWIKQIFAETQGKRKKGILPVTMINTRDLHSMGQYMADGKEIAFETSIDIEKSTELYIERYNKYLDTMNSIALKSVAKDHYDHNRITTMITLDELSPYNIGYLMAFFMISSAFGSYILGVDYSDQPGVEGYKKLMNEQLNI